MNKDYIRNFSIIAHIDHGKSTLADRIIQLCGAISDRKFKDQLLDNLDLERERGITIKSQTINLKFKSKKTGILYEFNLIDTPGHVDFSYEVSRALSSCEGVLLIVDASQGVEAQTLANLYLAFEYNLTIIPIINKIDLQYIDIDKSYNQLYDLGFNKPDCIPISAKNGVNIPFVLESIIEKIPPPKGDITFPLQALIFDAHYDKFRGVIIYTRIFNGYIKANDIIRFIHKNTTQHYKVEEVGIFRIDRFKKDKLISGQVGYIIANIKHVQDVKVGDTITHVGNDIEPLSGFCETKPVIFNSIYPVSTNDYKKLSDAIEKLKLNDAALTFHKDVSHLCNIGSCFASIFNVCYISASLMFAG